MSSRPIVRVSGLGKRYQLGELETFDSLRDAIPAATRRLLGLGRRSGGNGETGRESKEFWALKDVSFDVQEGEVLGIIGRNGAGKSTLLKILSRITEPTEGEVRIRGRVSSLLEVGTGFHPDLTGRENVYLNGTILGMTKREIDRKFDEIVDFSGVEKFLDTPVKRYSSGMSVRLAFAVAAHLEPDILIIDEVLAVGDAEFQRKCMGKVQDVAGEGRTVLFVSHHLGSIRALCGRGLLLRGGNVIFHGPIEDTVDAYMVSLTERDCEGSLVMRSGTGECRVTSCELLNKNGLAIDHAVAGVPLMVRINYAGCSPIENLDVTMTMYDAKAAPILNFSTQYMGSTVEQAHASGTVDCVVKKLPLLPGRYFVAVALHSHGVLLDHLPNVLYFDVSASTYFPTGKVPPAAYCACMAEHDWKVNWAT